MDVIQIHMLSTHYGLNMMYTNADVYMGGKDLFIGWQEFVPKIS